jgi:hypothetical protein
MEPEEILANRWNYHLKFNRRGHLSAATVKVRMAIVPLSNNGDSFIQPLETGRVWALRGTPGSERKSTEA